MPSTEVQTPSNAERIQSGQSFEVGSEFIPQEVSSVLDRTHGAAEEIIDFKKVRASEIGVTAFFRAMKILDMFKSGSVVVGVDHYAQIVDALSAERQQAAIRQETEAANQDSFRAAA